MTQEHNEELEYIGYDVSEHHHKNHTSHHNKHRKRRKKAKKVILCVVCVFLGLVTAAAVTLAVLIKTGKDKMLNDYANINLPEDISASAEDGGQTVIYKGEKYVYNKDITSILCMGIDRENLKTESGSFGASGQADANLLMVTDTSTGKISVININRDTVLDIKKYSVSGNYLGSEKKQLCLAFSNADGRQVSCENTVDAVSGLFYGIPINSYFAMDLAAIWPLTSAVGSVTVTPNETFTYGDITYVKGQKTVLDTNGKVTGYVRYRDVSELNSNLARMKRQQEFLTAFASAAVAKTKKNITFPVTLYNTANGYNINNIDVSKVAYLSSVILSKSDGSMRFYSVPGTVCEGETNAEYIVDEEKLFEMILEIFYLKV